MQRIKKNWFRATALKKVVVITGICFMIFMAFSSALQTYASTLPFYSSFETSSTFPQEGWTASTATPSNCPNLSGQTFTPAQISTTIAHTGSNSARMANLTAGASGSSSYGFNFNQSFTFTQNNNVYQAWFYFDNLSNAGVNSNQIWQIMTQCGNTAGTYWYVTAQYCTSCTGLVPILPAWIFSLNGDPVHCAGLIGKGWNLITVTEDGSGHATLSVNGVSACSAPETVTSGHDSALSFGQTATTSAACGGVCGFIRYFVDDVCINEASCPTGSGLGCNVYACQTSTYTISYSNETCIGSGCTATTTSTTISYDSTSTVVTYVTCSGSNCVTRIVSNNKTVTYTDTSVSLVHSTVTGTVTNTALNSPSGFSLQFWLVPLIFLMGPAFGFMGAYGSVTRERGGNVASNTALLFFLLGLNLGAIGGIILKVMPFPVLVLTFIPLVLLLYSMR